MGEQLGRRAPASCAVPVRAHRVHTVCAARLAACMPSCALLPRSAGRARRAGQVSKSVLPAMRYLYIQERAAESVRLACYALLKFAL